MRRSSPSWRRRLANSRSSARVIPRTVRTTAPDVVGAVPDRNRRLADGILVDACILARVLGIRLLTLDARVILLPADVKTPSSAPADARRPRTSARSSAVAPQPSGAIGHGLADAVRAINEGAAILAKARSDGSAGRASDT
jgi:hypothetical protein